MIFMIMINIGNFMRRWWGLRASDYLWY